MRTILPNEKVFLGGDFNGYIRNEANDFNLVYDGFSFGTRNESEQHLLEFSLMRDMVIVNSTMRKTNEH